MEYSVYNIIYRNDSTVKEILSRDLLYQKTGFIAFRGGDGRLWFLYKKEGIIVPQQQVYLDRTYGTRDVLPRVKKIKIGEDECECCLPTEECVRDFFVGLGRICACADWEIERRIWRIAEPSSSLYDASIRMVRPEHFLDRISILRCAYIKEKPTNRRNFTSFAGWEYITSYEITPEGDVAIVQKVSAQGGQQAEAGAADRKEAPGEAIAHGTAAEAVSGGVVSGEGMPGGTAAPEAVSGGAVPGEAVPGGATVPEAVSGGVVSGEGMPGGTAVPEAVSGGTVPGEVVPGGAAVPEAVSGGAVPGESVPGGAAVPEGVSDGAVPGEVVPGGAAVSEGVSGEAVPREAVSDGAVPGESVPGDAAVPETVSGGTVPGEGVPGDAAVPEAVSDGTVPGEGMPGDAAVPEVVSDGTVPGEAVSGGAAPAEAAASEASPEEMAVNGTVPGRAAAGQTASGEITAEGGPKEPAQGEALAGVALSQGAAPGTACTDGMPKQEAYDEAFIKDLLDCDKRRCRLESYEENMLYDINRGHWDLFDCAAVLETPGKEKLVPRDPRKDIKTGVVGIDFGTKSTVVVRQDDTSAIIPIRVGAEMLSGELRENDYENPTIIECTDLDGFMRKYYGQAGRPQTSCDDFFVSYDAYSDYRSCSPNEFYAYYADLKQWANHEKDNVMVVDKQKNEYRFSADSSEREKVINPIELYAYYIGMYINNMRNGIYMKYLMSFPVGYSKETRQLIVTSFEKGIRKSLPLCVLEDEECMKEFSVQLGISEPAAYAVTALEMSDLEPKDENDRYRYGIFDFGGGTADFGFGIWRGASEEEYEVEGYDYVLECFGADSDVTLGGEKILELLAYAVFKDNRELARGKRIPCSLPYGEQAFPGSEILISNSQIARRNMSILKEELRPLWHQEENWDKKYRHGTQGDSSGGDGAGYAEYIEPSLYDIDGNKLSDCRFAVNTQELISLIKARIQKGIDAFFKCMSKAFQRGDGPSDHEGQMYIFLAGNSSKSVFVRELFEKTIQDYSYKHEGSWFKLVEPLNGESRDEYVPNGKTSVAYGLIKSREGSSIKVEKNFETDAEEQTRFKYYLGRERRRHFDCRLSPAETEYGSWVRFQGAAVRTVRIYYTTNPTADFREEPPVIDNIPYKEIMIEPKKEAFLFIRSCEPTAIQYTVACSEETIGVESEICRIDFGM